MLIRFIRLRSFFRNVSRSNSRKPIVRLTSPVCSGMKPIMRLGASAAPITASANDYPEVFSSIQAIVASGTAPQTFSEPMPDSTDGLTLVDATIALQNRGLFAAEWLDIRVNGVAGDIAVYSLTGQGSDVAARSSAQINLKLITRAPAETARTAVISYYVYGVQRSIEVSF